jgi:hypothetical protein
MPGKFSNLGYKARGSANLAGLARMVLFAESDFTKGWPTKADITAGEVTTAPPLADTVVGAELTFDHGSGRGKSAKKGPLGYQSYDHSVECKFAGVSKEQMATVDKFLNEGGVAIAYYKNGTRRVFGASWNPLVIEDGDDSGAKGDDQNQISFSGTAMGLDFHAPFVAAATEIPTDAAAVKPMPFDTSVETP